MDKNLSKVTITSEQIALAAIFYFGQVFIFLQANQQKRVGMVSTNNTQRIYSDQIYERS